MTSNEFEKRIRQIKDKLYRFAFSILKNRDDAQDAIQDVVLKLWKSRSTLDRAQNLESYCLNAVKNQCFDVLRKQNSRIEYEKTLMGDSSVENQVEYVDLLEKIKTELQKLPAQQRMALELRDFQGMEYDEISEILQQSINSVRVNVSRGRKKLFEIFKTELKNA